MPASKQNPFDCPVIIFIPSGGDARGAAGILARDKIRSEIVGSMEELCARATESAGALLLTEETLDDPALRLLQLALKRQPAWSDLPLILLTRSGETTPLVSKVIEVLDDRVNLTLLERPLRGFALSSAVKVALRSRRHQYEVRDLLESYALAMEGGQMGSWDFDYTTRQIRRSLRHDELFGYDALQPEWTLETSLEKIVPEDRERVRTALEQATQNGSLNIECQVRWADNSLHWISSQAQRFDDAQGRPRRLSGVIMEVTDRRERENAARVERERLDVVLEGTDVGLWYWDIPENVMTWNVRCRELHGIALTVPLSMMAFSAQVLPEDLERIQSAIKLSLEDGRLYDVEYRSVGKKWLRAIGRVFYNSLGKPLRFDGITMDVTARKEEEETLRQAQRKLIETAEQLELRVKERTAKLEETVSEMEAFSYSVSHDLRAPLRAMQGYSLSLITEYAEKLDGQGREFLQRIAKNAERLDRLTQDLLTYSRVVRAPISLGPINLERLIGDVLEQYPAFQSSNAEIVVRTPLHDVTGHEASLTQCVSNLLGNAIKFILPGTKPHIIIWTELAENTVRIYFEDNGLGIEKNHLERIFKMFERVNKNYEGTGIGLAIVKKAVQRMNGTINVESTPGQGSKFCIELPAAHE